MNLPHKNYAEILREAINRGDNNRLAYIIVSRSEYDLMDILQSYDQNGFNFDNQINSMKGSESYKLALLTISNLSALV